MKYITGVNRSQITLMPGFLDDYVGEDNVAPVIDAFVNQVDLAVPSPPVYPQDWKTGWKAKISTHTRKQEVLLSSLAA